MPANKKGSFLSRIFINSLVVALSLFKIIPNLIFCIEAEAKLAGKNLVYLITLYLLAGALFASFCLCLSAMGVLYLISLHFSAISSIFIVLIIHLLFLILILIVLSKIKNNLAFSRTRRLLHDILRKNN